MRQLFARFTLGSSSLLGLKLFLAVFLLLLIDFLLPELLAFLLLFTLFLILLASPFLALLSSTTARLLLVTGTLLHNLLIDLVLRFELNSMRELYIEECCLVDIGLDVNIFVTVPAGAHGRQGACGLRSHGSKGRHRLLSRKAILNRHGGNLRLGCRLAHGHHWLACDRLYLARHSLRNIDMHGLYWRLGLRRTCQRLRGVVSIDVGEVLARRLGVAALLRGAKGLHNSRIVVFYIIDRDRYMALSTLLRQGEAVWLGNMDLFSGLRCRLLGGLLLKGLLGGPRDLWVILCGHLLKIVDFHCGLKILPLLYFKRFNFF